MISSATSASALDFIRATTAVVSASGRPSGASSRSSVASGDTLTPEQRREISKLADVDRQVRAHEQAHLNVGRDLVRGGPSFEYQKGPDGKDYAVSGEVSIDTSPGRTPEETIPKAIHIRNTALAPNDPSAQDQSVAATASRMEAEARREVERLQAANAASGTAGAAGTAAYAAVQQISAPTGAARVDLFA
ncbi:hypothetical protein HCX48_06615 [Rhodocyclus tenuis]|uniref:Catalase n=2 Tax=Rhodocyclus TaxID=1064 RepID=A0A6L5JX74_RHOTE|nr:putative metalloprotease CJM1_0395 family protein [Rhodocyclus gracilis]MQY51180.1 hypothetical protein [Rhodocyclus gracilis]MRD71934.1 hypothetical protein [Rhodocyclus gracilis]NJA88889.1 hypothetical protein [Rhodocyclus gracilis]